MQKIGFIAGNDGAVVKYDPKLHAAVSPKLLSRHQRATLYFKAVRYIRELFKEVGFKEITRESHGSFTIELGSFILDMTVRESKSLRIVHVTSYPGYVYDSNKINAKITQHSVGDHGEYVIQVGAVLPSMKSCTPIYVVIDKNSDNPLREAFMSALASAKQLIEKDPATLSKIQSALAGRNLNSDFERFSQQDEVNQLPTPAGE